MGKQPVQGQKKTKDAIAKAASQKKAGAKVHLLLVRNGPREKSKKKPIMLFSSIKPPTTDLSLVSPNSESISPPLLSSKNTKLLDLLLESSLENVSRMDQSDQLKTTADKLCSLQCKLLRRLHPLLPKPNRLLRRENPKRNDVVSHIHINSLTKQSKQFF
jgi:hypothetical protein